MNIPRHTPTRRGRRGNCYVTIEALYHLMGGAEAGLVVRIVRHEGDVHWYLVQRVFRDFAPYRLRGQTRFREVYTEVVIDPTVLQFKTPPPYEEGRGRGFLTKEPSRRAREMMDRMLYQEQKAPAGRSKKRRTA